MKLVSFPSTELEGIEMNHRVTIALTGVLACALSLAPASAAAQEVTLRLHTFMPPIANPVRTFLIPWA